MTLLHVVEQSDLVSPEHIDPFDWQMRKVAAQSYLNTVCQEWHEYAGQRPECVLLEGPAAATIVDYVTQNDPDLIVLNSHGQSGLTGWNVSSVAHKVIYRAFNTFALVRAYKPQVDAAAHYRRIMVPLDGSKRAEFVVPLATQLAQAQAAELWLVHVVARPSLMEQAPPTPDDSKLVERLTSHNVAAAEHYLQQLREGLAYPAETRLLTGDSDSDTLLKLIEESEVDLVILNAHGMSGERVRPYGSVANSLITYSSAHLLVVQDFPRHEIQPSQAELLARNGGSLPRLVHVEAAN